VSLVTGAPGLQVSLTVQFGDVNADALSYGIIWGDGSPSASGALSSPYASVPASHTYAWAGVYTLRVTVTDFKHPAVAQTFSVTVGPPVDDDTDGLSDDYEAAHACLLVGTNDAGVDADSDGLTNAQEYQQGTNPCLPDSDGDGYTDGQEAALPQNAGGMVYCSIMRADIQPSPTGDGMVSVLDLALLAGNFLQAVPPAPARLDQDGDHAISILDLAALSGRFLNTVNNCP
jgi:PKD domain/Bacterial TSP3 repeat